MGTAAVGSAESGLQVLTAQDDSIDVELMLFLGFFCVGIYVTLAFQL